MKVVQLFDRYLNTTMNWAYRLIRNTPGTKNIIVSPTVVRNRFFDTAFDYFEDPIQKSLHFPTVDREWDISKIRRLWDSFALRTYFPIHVKNVIVREQTDIIHAHFAHVGVVYTGTAAKLRIPFIVSFYGTDYERLPFEKPRYRMLYQKMFEVATFVVCEGKNGAQLLRKLGCQIEKIRIVKLGIDIASIPYFTRLKRANALALVQAATFTETKGLLYTVQAFLLALKECPQMTLTLVGEKWDKRYWEKVERLITSSGHLDKIQVLDFVENDFHQFISRFDVFIHPSCYSSLMECEGGAPIVLLDAQAVGLPIISTVHCDIPEEVVDGQTGFLSNERDVVSLKNSIVRFYHMENEEYQGFSHRARKHVFEHYDSVKNSQAMKIVYDEALLSGKKTLAD